MTGFQNIGIIILAAGGSARLGQPKQLLPYAGTTLLQHAIHAATESVADYVIVVVGSRADEISKAIEPGKAVIVVNTNWQEGMASSIRCGINELIKDCPQTNGVLLMLCDQPHVTAALLNDLITAHQNTGKPIVASNYNGAVGAPALFHKSIFPKLLQLKGDIGARSVIQRHDKDVAVVAFSKGNVDIDTAADYEALRQVSE